MNDIDNFINNVFTPNNIILILVLFLIILSTIIVIMILKSVKEEKTKNNEIKIPNNEIKKSDTFNIEAVTKLLEENMDKERTIAVNEYENEQEKKAIISYEELLKNASSLTINYEDEPGFDGVKVRKVEIEKAKKPINEEPKSKIENKSFYSYEREEEFLKVLKQFRANL